MGKARLGVIGAGSWAVASHLPNLRQRADELEFVGVARKGREHLARIQADYGFGMASEDYRDILDAGVDLVVVASPSGLHHEHAKAALEAGAHVLVEKPVTIDPRHAWDLATTADRLGRHLVVCLRMELPTDGGQGQGTDGPARHRRGRADHHSHGFSDPRAAR